MTRNRRLPRFLCAVSASMLGDWLTTVAVMVAVYAEAGGRGAAGYVFVRVAPRLVGSLSGGIADRRDPARVLAAANAVQALLSLLLAGLLAQRRVLPALACVAACQAVGAAQRPAHLALIPRLASDAALPRANALYMGTWSASLMLGPALAGPALLVLAPAALVLLDAASFAVCAAVALTLQGGGPRRPQPPAPESAPRLSMLARAWSDRTLRVLALAYLASGLMMTAASACFADAARELLGGAGSAGWLFTVAGVGSLAGSAAALRLRPSGRVPVWAALAGGAALEWLTLAGFGALPAVAAALIALAVCGAASSVWEAWGATAAQRRAGAGRVAGTFSVAVAATYAGMVAGAAFALAALPALGWRATVLVAALVGAALVVVGTSIPPPRRVAQPARAAAAAVPELSQLSS